MGSREGSEKMSSDTVSSALFHDRPIRPLPRRRLRERLSPDVADSIKYPPTPQSTAPLFYYPYMKGDPGAPGVEASTIANRENTAELAQDVSLRRGGLNTSCQHNDEGLRSQPDRTQASNESNEPLNGSTSTPSRSSQTRFPHPQPPPSTTSSADGYESFENTNNKKKRKIPSAGESMMNGPHGLGDAGVLGMSSTSGTGENGSSSSSHATSMPYYQSIGTSSTGIGISGPGRGRFGRARNGRSPLRALPDPNASWPGRSTKLRSGDQYSSSPAGENSGIISNAIASAEKLAVPQGQENISLLHQQTPSKTGPVSSQFTFTFGSEVPGTVPWPGSDPVPPHMAAGPLPSQDPVSRQYRDQYSGVNARATQTAPVPIPGSVGNQPGTNAPADAGKGTTAVQRKPKRRGNPLLQAARQRRQQTAYQNYHHPPAPEDIWICEFCEYERIFGHPPEALIRQYEIKDRRRRREEAERRRLLEKAKMKSRKGKKASKLPPKTNATGSDRNQALSPGNQAPQMGNEPSQETQSEEFDEEEYLEDDVHNDDGAPSGPRSVAAAGAEQQRDRPDTGGGRRLAHDIGVAVA